MATLGTMKTRIADELHRSDLTTQITRAISTAIAHWENERFYFNEGFRTIGTVANRQTYSAGDSLTDVLAVNSVRLTFNDSNTPLTEWTYKQLAENNVSAAQRGTPDFYVWYASSLLFYPVPNQTYTALLTALLHITTTASDSASNAWTTDAETLIRQRALAIVRTDHLRDSAAHMEAKQMVGTDCLSALELQALTTLRKRTETAGTGRIMPTKF